MTIRTMPSSSGVGILGNNAGSNGGWSGDVFQRINWCFSLQALRTFAESFSLSKFWACVSYREKSFSFWALTWPWSMSMGKFSNSRRWPRVLTVAFLFQFLWLKEIPFLLQKEDAMSAIIILQCVKYSMNEISSVIVDRISTLAFEASENQNILLSEEALKALAFQLDGSPNEYWDICRKSNAFEILDSDF